MNIVLFLNINIVTIFFKYKYSYYIFTFFKNKIKRHETLSYGNLFMLFWWTLAPFHVSYILLCCDSSKLCKLYKLHCDDILILLRDKKIVGNKWEIACESIDAMHHLNVSKLCFPIVPRPLDNNFAKSTFRFDNSETALRSSIDTYDGYIMWNMTFNGNRSCAYMPVWKIDSVEMLM